MSTALQCPCCFGEIHPEAVICPHCGSGLQLVRPLLVRLRQLDAKVEELQVRSQQQQMTLESLSQRGALWLSAPQANASSELATLVHATPPSASVQLAGLGAAFSGIMLLHWVLLFALDARPLVLRVSTLLLPIGVSWWVYRSRVARLASLAPMALLLGCSSVLGMLSVTSVLDQVPLLPVSVRDWREVAEYSLGIALAYLAGGLTAQALTSHLAAAHRPPSTPLLVLLLERDAAGKLKVEEIVSQLNRIIVASAPVVTGATAFYSGLKGVLDQ